jgi:5-methyltetrahydrofolate--homocysteine methyltransferase
MSALDEMRAAATAANAVGIPYTVTASFDTAGKTMMGLAPEALAALTENFAPKPLALGANCGVGASDLLVSILAMTAARPEQIVIAKANAGTPDLMADYARLAVNSGARIIGGCCGTSPEHLAAMRRALDTRVPGERPDEARIVAALGPLASPPAKAQAPRERRRR